MDAPPKTRVCLLALIGLPAAGKTSFCHWLYALPQRHFNFAHLCYDDLLQVPQDVTKFTFKTQRLEILETLQSLVNAIKGTQSGCSTELHSQFKMALVAGSRDYVIACDDNNYYRSMRYELYQLCRNIQCAYAQVYFECNLSVALQRNANRPAVASVPQHVLQQMATRLEPPDVQCYAWESPTLTLNALEQPEGGAELILSFIDNSIDCIPQPLKLQTKTSTPHTLLHQLDLLLRRRIGQILQNIQTTKEQQQEAIILNAKRKDILQRLKQDDNEKELSEEDLCNYVNLLH